MWTKFVMVLLMLLATTIASKTKKTSTEDMDKKIDFMKDMKAIQKSYPNVFYVTLTIFTFFFVLMIILLGCMGCCIICSCCMACKKQSEQEEGAKNVANKENLQPVGKVVTLSTTAPEPPLSKGNDGKVNAVPPPV